MERPGRTRIVGGVEFFPVGWEEEAQCARCGSSVTDEVTGYGCGDGVVTLVCISTPEWCEAHPIRGREFQKGAGR